MHFNWTHYPLLGQGMRWWWRWLHGMETFSHCTWWNASMRTQMVHQLMSQWRRVIVLLDWWPFVEY